jgi:hypothetical protein
MEEVCLSCKFLKNFMYVAHVGIQVISLCVMRTILYPKKIKNAECR